MIAFDAFNWFNKGEIEERDISKGGIRYQWRWIF